MLTALPAGSTVWVMNIGRGIAKRHILDVQAGHHGVSAVAGHSIAIVLIAAFFEIVWFGVCLGQLSGYGLVEIHVCVEVHLATEVIFNPERDLLADIHPSPVLVGVRAIRIRAGISISVMKDKIRPRGLIHLSINDYVVIDREVNEHQTRLG